MSHHFIGTCTNLLLFAWAIAKGELLASAVLLLFASLSAWGACAAESEDERRAREPDEDERTRAARERWERTWRITREHIRIARFRPGHDDDTNHKDDDR